MNRRSKPAQAVGRIVFALIAGAGATTSAAALTASSASASTPAPSATVSYSATESFPLGGASKFTDSSGDGWDTALSSTQVFNVFHHQSTLEVDCHDQSTGASCWAHPKTITDDAGHNFATSSLPGLYLDQDTGQLFVYAVRTSDESAGVVCIDTTQPASATGDQLFCGYTKLTAGGQAPIALYAGVSNPMQIGSNWYAFNEVAGTGAGAENQLLCFNLVTDAACASQPFALDLGGDPLASFAYASPIGSTGNQVIVQVVGTAGDELACFNGAADSSCSGSWPITVASSEGAPSLLNAGDSPVGVCLPIAGDPCFNMAGGSVATPPGMAAAISANSFLNGNAVVLGTREYVANNVTTQVDCYDYGSQASCPDFPKSFVNLFGLYTVRLDPFRPDCIWVNADHGSAGIQNFDVLTGGDCPPGPIRVNASSFVAPYNRCLPTNFTSLQVTSPGAWHLRVRHGRVRATERDTHPGPSDPADRRLREREPRAARTHHQERLASIRDPLNGETQATGQLTVKLTWTGNKASQCTSAARRSPPSTATGSTRPTAASSPTGRPTSTARPGRSVLNRSMVGMASTRPRAGYWLVASDGGLFAFGDAGFYGSTGALTLNRPVVGMASTPDGRGYWLVASDGGLFAFGDAEFYGSTGALVLNQPDRRAWPRHRTGAATGWSPPTAGMFAFGDAAFYGSIGGLRPQPPIVGMASPDGQRYWLVASDGGIFAFGDAGFYGSTGSCRSTGPWSGWPRRRTGAATGSTRRTEVSSRSATQVSTDRPGTSPSTSRWSGWRPRDALSIGD